MTGYEYNNTMRDLLGIDLDFSKDLPPDTRSVDGFRTTVSIWKCRTFSWRNATRQRSEAYPSRLLKASRLNPSPRVTQALKVFASTIWQRHVDASLGGSVVSYSLKASNEKKSKTPQECHGLGVSQEASTHGDIPRKN